MLKKRNIYRVIVQYCKITNNDEEVFLIYKIIQMNIYFTITVKE